MDGETFYRNVFLLTQAVQPTQEFLKHFKEGMFEKPNTIGFQHVSHYLLTIYDPERCKKHLQWPLHCKKTEAKFRADIRDILTSIAQENLDVDFPQILASHLLHASGSKFNSIMANLSTVVLRAWIKRETGTMLLVPKAGAAHEVSKIMLDNLIMQNTKMIDDCRRKMSKNDTEAKELFNEVADSIKKYEDELFQTRQSIIKLSSEAPVHPDMKDRLADPNDVDVVQMWKRSFDESIGFLKRKQHRLQQIADLSTNVSSMIGSIISTDANLLDGKLLPEINIEKLSEIDALSPETQVMLYRVYESETLVLENFLSLFHHILTDLRRHIDKHGFLDLSGCESQISASCEDMKSMNNLFRDMYNRIIELTSHARSSTNRRDRFSSYLRPYNVNQDLFDSVLLKSSPTININLNPESDGNEFHERLELTPVENVHRELFARHKRNGEATTQITKLRPKLLVSRINFDDTRCSSTSEKLSPASRNISSRMIDQWNANRDGKYSRVFSTHSKRTANRLKCSMRPISNSSRINFLTDMNSTCDVYNASELRTHLNTKNTYVENPDIYSPQKFTPVGDNINNRESSTAPRSEDEKSMLSSEFTVAKEEAQQESKKGAEQITKIRQSTKSPKRTEKPTNKRFSISDLVERYRKVCDNSVDVTVRMNFSSDESDKD